MKRYSFVFLMLSASVQFVYGQDQDQDQAQATGNVTVPVKKEVAKLVTDRPTQTVSSTVVPMGSFQLEAGSSIEFTPQEGTRKDKNSLLAPTTLLRYGVSQYFELRAVSQFESRKSPFDENRTSGMGDLQLGVKVRILDKPGVNTKVAWMGHVQIPTGSRGISEDVYKGIGKLTVSHVLSETVNLGYSMGYDYFTEKNGDFNYTMVLGIAVNDRVGLFIEPYGEVVRLKTFEASFDAGFVYLLKENLQLDFSYGSGLNYKMNYLALGMSWNTSKK